LDTSDNGPTPVPNVIESRFIIIFIIQVGYGICRLEDYQSMIEQSLTPFHSKTMRCDSSIIVFDFPTFQTMTLLLHYTYM